MSEIAIAKQHKGIETSLSSFLLSFAFSHFITFVWFNFFYFDRSLLLSHSFMNITSNTKKSSTIKFDKFKEIVCKFKNFIRQIWYDRERTIFTSHLKPHSLYSFLGCLYVLCVRDIIHASVTYIYTKAIHYNSFRFKRSLWTVEFNFQFFSQHFFEIKFAKKYKCR